MQSQADSESAQLQNEGGALAFSPPALQLAASPIQRAEGDSDGMEQNHEAEEKVSEQEIRSMMVAMGMESSNGGTTPASTNVTPEVAVEIMRNMSEGKAPFKPEVGKGGASWFVTEGNPYVGIDAAKNISVPVELSGMENAIRFDEGKLTAMHDRLITEVAVEAEAKYRQFKNLTPDQQMNSSQRKGLTRFIKRFAESRMWDQVGREVGSSSSGMGEVVLEPGSRFSRTPGKFAVAADASKVQVKGGMEGMIANLKSQGLGAEPVAVEASKEWARQKNVGRVKAVFRWGGRLLIVVGVAMDAYRIYNAEDRVRETVSVAGGWTGATVFAGAFATWFAPADVAGPGAWICHGIGTLVAGGIGYVVGSETSETLYELIVEE